MNKLAIYLLFFFVTLINVNSLFGQKYDKAKEFYKKYMTEKLALTTSEADKLWSIMEEYNNAMRALREDLPNSELIANLTKTEARALLARSLKRRQEEVRVYEAYVSKLEKILPIEKVAQIEYIDTELRHKLMRRMKGNKSGYKGDDKKDKN